MTSTVAPAVIEAAPEIGRPRLPAGHRVELDGRGELFVRHLPRPDGAPTVMLLHGGAVTGALNWHQCFDALAQRYGVVSHDHRGHGRSGMRNRRFRLEDAADDVVALADHLGIERFVPVGYSMGGAAAQLVWARHPDRVAGVVLCATWSRFWRNGRERRLLQALSPLGTGSRALSRSRGLDLFLSAAERHSTVQRRPPWMVAEVRAGSVPMMVEALGTVAAFDSSEWVGDIDVPVALIVMNRDDVVPPDRQHHLVSLLPHASVEYLDMTHDGCVTEPGLFVPALLDALDDVIAPGSR